MTVLAREGLTGLSVRKVASEAHLAPASLRHVLPTQDALRLRCLVIIEERVTSRVRGHVSAGLDTGSDLAVAMLQEVLPLDDARRLELLTQVQLGVLAVSDPSLREASARLSAGVRRLCTMAVLAIATGSPMTPSHEVPSALDVSDTADRLHASVDGIALQTLLDPETYPPSTARRRLRSCVTLIRDGAPGSASRR